MTGVVLMLMLLSSVHPAWAQFDKVLKGLGGSASAGGGLHDARIASGLQEALKVGTENAVLQTGQRDVFLPTKRSKS